MRAQGLIETLEKETEIYRELLDLSYAKREAIQREKVSELEKIIDQEQGLIVTLFKLEEMREKAMDKLLRDLDIDHVENVDELSQYLSPLDKKRVLQAKGDLYVVVKNVSDESSFNHKLMEDKLEFIKMTMDLLTATHDHSGRYDKDASDEDYERKNIFDVRV